MAYFYVDDMFYDGDDRDHNLLEDELPEYDAWLAERAFYLSYEEDFDLLVQEDRLEDIADSCIIDEFDKERYSVHSDPGRGRPRSKGVTLRSWRNPRAIGGSVSRKAITRKMDLRRPIKPIIFVPFHGVSGCYAPG